MNRRKFMKSVAGSSALMLAPQWSHAQPRSQRPHPNIIIILADDLGYGDLGCYGNQTIKTPNLDQLAAQGIRFLDFHSSCPVCSPTRAGLMTGRYQQRCNVPEVITARHHRDHGLPLYEITFAEQLHQLGYVTGVFGKWHLGYAPRFNPTRQGFDQFRGYVSGNVDYFSHIDQTGVADWWHNAELEPEDGYSTHLITEHAVGFIQENRDKPFCLYVAHEAPHYPYQGPGDRGERTAGGEFPTQGGRKDVDIAYKEMVETMDQGVGRILEALRENKIEKDTFVFFFSDNGATKQGSNGSLRGFKGSLWEGGHRVPAIASWPGKIEAGQVTHELAISLDLFPTVLEIAETPVPDDRSIDGISLCSLFLKNESIGKRTLFWSFKNQRAVRDDNWKLVIPDREDRNSGFHLFDLSKDVEEKINLAEHEPKLVKDLIQRLTSWETDVQFIPLDQ